MRVSFSSARAFALAATALLVIACRTTSTEQVDEPTSDRVDPLTIERGGARLQARGAELDGFFRFDAFFDTKLGVECGVSRGGPTEPYRCQPLVTMDSACLPRPPPAFSPDDLVTFDEVRVPITSSIGIWFLEGSDGSRYPGGLFDVHRRRHCHAVQLEDGSSIVRRSPAAREASALSIRPAIPDSAFPELVTTTVPHARLTATILVNDGQPVQRAPGFHDTVRDEPCNVLNAENGKRRCLPNGAYEGSSEYYVDDQCTALAVQGFGHDDDPPPRYVILRRTVGCVGEERIYTANPVARAFTMQSGKCIALPKVPTQAVTRGDEIPLSTFAEAVPVTR